MKDTSKLSIKANKIIENVERTETSIDQFINKYCGNGKIAVDDLLGMYDKDGDEHKFIQKYAETNLTYSGTIISICAYIFAIVAILFTLLLYVYEYIIVLVAQSDISVISQILIFLLTMSLILIILITLMYLFGSVLNVIPKLDRNKAIIMSIADKWKDQDESHINPDTKNKEEDGTTMNAGYKAAIVKWIFGLIFGVLMIVGVISTRRYHLATGWDAFGPLSNILLVSVLVIVTGYYARQVAKQTEFMKIDRMSREMDKLVAPLYSKKDTTRMFNGTSINDILLDGAPAHKVAYYEFWTGIKENKYLGPIYLRSAINDYLDIASVPDKTSKLIGSDMSISTPNSDEIKKMLHTKTKKRYDELEIELSILNGDSSMQICDKGAIIFGCICGAVIMIITYKMQWW